MKELCLLAVVVASIAGCASTTAESGTGPAKERVSDAYVPTGTIIPRKRSERGAGASAVAEVDKQALENERVMSTRR
jgi:hypothetical protein